MWLIIKKKIYNSKVNDFLANIRYVCCVTTECVELYMNYEMHVIALFAASLCYYLKSQWTLFEKTKLGQYFKGSIFKGNCHQARIKRWQAWQGMATRLEIFIWASNFTPYIYFIILCIKDLLAIICTFNLRYINIYFKKKN